MLTRSFFFAASFTALLAVACGSGGDDNPFDRTQLAALVTDLGLGGEEPERDVPLAPEDTFTPKLDLTDEWVGGHRSVAVVSLDVDMVIVDVELFDDEGSAARRFNAEQTQLAEAIGGAFGVRVEPFNTDAGEGCQAFSILSGGIVDQHEVHCQLATLFIMARSSGEDAAIARPVAERAAAEVVRRAREALAAATAESG